MSHRVTESTQDGRGCFAERFRESGRQRPRIHRSRDGIAGGDPSDDRPTQHLREIRRSERPTGFCDNHDSGRTCRERVPDGPPERDVTLTHNDDRRVRHLEHRSCDGTVGNTDVDDREWTVPQCNRKRGATLGGRRRFQQALGSTTRQQGETGDDLDAQTIERVRRRGGSGSEPIRHTGFRIGAQAEDRGLVTTKIHQPDRAEGVRGMECARSRDDRSTGATFG